MTYFRSSSNGTGEQKAASSAMTQCGGPLCTLHCPLAVFTIVWHFIRSPSLPVSTTPHTNYLTSTAPFGKYLSYPSHRHPKQVVMGICPVCEEDWPIPDEAMNEHVESHFSSSGGGQIEDRGQSQWIGMGRELSTERWVDGSDKFMSASSR